MTILAIDTSNDAMGIALVKDKQIIASYTSINKNKHSTRLMPAIDRLMKDANIEPSQLSKIAVAIGPGSYTGVRIGLSIAKTMAWSLDIPIVGLSSLKILTLSLTMYDYKICPFFDARRGLVFTGLYNSDGTIEIEEQNIKMTDWLDRLATLDVPIVFVSPDIELYESMIQESLKEHAHFAPKGFHVTQPGLLGIESKEYPPDDVHTLIPQYLRLVEAEAKWLESQKDGSK
ncbi:tRNA threonylcarbamoyladenosine biosynthesis protein TsaB [Pelagirhabdus alkalitolerans]|uniref:tRNA threonylcarbamoyladenosine biosynthesis protein TsaB n=1 Tax=Pelagirhabdus alkalitolerans TaxID=1612202 RepID=A0A1G6J476_9BACI|nr:tRNA (adenosine(37)-N6)-threonylcarbamoyltransferase complex dimerization subunit type 1 TsaB [Pelagirhabdus alkalitolerans]SDC13065.1 tRNA threonylcarbamoyladenosine biosynthesis protein TsaB [Pelagirhabdus alkalitolerans]